MALLSQLFRRAAISGRADPLDASWFAGRQGGRWASQTVNSALAGSRAKGIRRRELDDLEGDGVVSKAEADALRDRLGL
jgi:hypothetical protein